MRIRSIFLIFIFVFAAVVFPISYAMSPVFADSSSGTFQKSCVSSPTARHDAITPLTFARLAQCHMNEVVVVRAEVKDSSKKENESGNQENQNETLSAFPYQRVRFPLY